ncbi:MAG: hypothetical protein AAGF77_05895 [Bacteroidota bacterium]
MKKAFFTTALFATIVMLSVQSCTNEEEENEVYLETIDKDEIQNPRDKS